ncbi:MAG: ABC transporter ATP-binding protein [Cyanobacteria bacterium NC_groundwater_1444_Ag_S-0.65um_54_12]|nr:ABC transporter ATP-binding protein [Cyanobacteria bacterium NC_groundwater_1444_Ag_S-0.65um_54_12]
MTSLNAQLEHVEKFFDTKYVLQGVDIVFVPGQITVIIGPSGCGKSTILRLLLGLQRPDAGRVLVDGRDLATFRRADWFAYREQLGMVFQSAALFDSLTIIENVAFALLEHAKLAPAESYRIAEEKLRLVGLKDQGNLRPGELSGGMQKRVAIARAIARDPALVLYDEPTTGLDPITSTVIEDLIVLLTRQLGVTSIVVTHQLSTIFRTADRVVMLLNGKIIGEGSPAGLRESTDPRIRGFLRGEVPPGWV